MDHPRLQAGTVVAGRYRLVRLLGGGAMGAVWLGERLDGGGEVALKFLLETAAQDERQRGRFEREAAVALQLQSPHLVRTLEYGFAGEVPFIVMERLVGEDLGRRLRARARLPLGEVAAFVAGVARGVAVAHARGLVHRDLKPANVFFSNEGGREVVKVLDFGVVKVPGLGVTARTQTGELVGTPKFMSPEQLRGDRELDARADLWSLGVIAYRAATGAQPFEGANLAEEVTAICSAPIRPPSAVLPTLPPAFDAWFARACSRDLARRFSSAAELAQDLERLAGDPTSGPCAPAPSGGSASSWVAPRAPVPAPSGARSTPRAGATTVIDPALRRSSARPSTRAQPLSPVALIATFVTAVGISIGVAAVLFRKGPTADAGDARALVGRVAPGPPSGGAASSVPHPAGAVPSASLTPAGIFLTPAAPSATGSSVARGATLSGGPVLHTPQPPTAPSR